MIHSVDESVDLSEIERIALAEALFIHNLGEVRVEPGARLEA
jgi:acetylornithine deacetylase/succinyl-diaminopimelate desuccinylase-like protein